MWRPWKRQPSTPKVSPEMVRAVLRLAVETQRVAEQLERAQAHREGKTP